MFVPVPALNFLDKDIIEYQNLVKSISDDRIKQIMKNCLTADGKCIEPSLAVADVNLYWGFHGSNSKLMQSEGEGCELAKKINLMNALSIMPIISIIAAIIRFILVVTVIAPELEKYKSRIKELSEVTDTIDKMKNLEKYIQEQYKKFLESPRKENEKKVVTDLSKLLKDSIHKYQMVSSDIIHIRMHYYSRVDEATSVLAYNIGRGIGESLGVSFLNSLIGDCPVSIKRALNP